MAPLRPRRPADGTAARQVFRRRISAGFPPAPPLPAVVSGTVAQAADLPRRASSRPSAEDSAAPGASPLLPAAPAISQSPRRQSFRQGPRARPAAETSLPAERSQKLPSRPPSLPASTPAESLRAPGTAIADRENPAAARGSILAQPAEPQQSLCAVRERRACPRGRSAATATAAPATAP